MCSRQFSPHLPHLRNVRETQSLMKTLQLSRHLRTPSEARGGLSLLSQASGREESTSMSGCLLLSAHRQTVWPTSMGRPFHWLEKGTEGELYWEERARLGGKKVSCPQMRGKQEPGHSGRAEEQGQRGRMHTQLSGAPGAFRLTQEPHWQGECGASVCCQ